MKMFRLFLMVEVLSLIVYTFVVGKNQGWNLFPLFFADIAAMTWPGQFNFDFLMFLILSGLWLTWRHHFSIAGFALGLLGLFGGTMFLAPYLLYESFRAKGDIKILLLGEKRASA